MGFLKPHAQEHIEATDSQVPVFDLPILQIYQCEDNIKGYLLLAIN